MPKPIGSYPSKPFDVWRKFKGLRAGGWGRDTCAKEQGMLRGTGAPGGNPAIQAFGPLVGLPGEPFWAICGNFQEFGQERFEAHEAQGGVKA